jgi:ADP-heptose:LPS heptosyltransferase
MRITLYRYRPIHALLEKLLALLAPLISSKDRLPLRETPRKVLVLKFGGMGEAILARSLVERLRERNPSMSIDYLVEDRTMEIMTSVTSGEIFKYSPRKDGFLVALKTLFAIRSRGYDAILDFEQDSLLTAAFTRATSISVRVGFAPPSTSPRRGMFTHPVTLGEEDSMWSGFIRIGRVLDPGLSESLMTVPLPYSCAADEWISEWRRSHLGPDYNGRVVVMHIGVGPSAQYRRWPMQRFVELATWLSRDGEDLTIILTGAKEEQPLIAEFQGLFTGKSVDASGLGKLERVAALLRNCDLLVSNDTGIMHLGASMGTPTVGVFGASNPVWWAPVGQRATYVYTTQMSCSPCINSYRRHIPKSCTAEKQSACMWDISVDAVLQATRRVMRKTSENPFERVLS